jgi:hypothetical protein
MKIKLTHKQANLLAAILWELTEEKSTVVGTSVWRLGQPGLDICADIFALLEDANDSANRRSGKDRDPSGAPKGTILDAKWTA